MEQPARSGDAGARRARPGSRAAGGAASCRAARSASSARTCAPCGGTRSRSSASASRTRAPRLVDRAAAALHHQIRQRQVVAEARVDLDVVGAAHRVDRAVAAGDRAEPRLGAAHAHLVPPVDALLVPAVGARGSSAGRRRRRRPGRRTARTSRRSASGAQVAFASEKATISPSVWRTARSCAATLPPRGFEITATPGYWSAISSVRSVDASEVTTISSLSRRVVEREQVLDPPRDHRLLVVGRDDHRDGRLDVTRPARGAAPASRGRRR